MKKYISLMVAAVMVLTLIYTPAGLVYGAEGEGPQAEAPPLAPPEAEDARRQARALREEGGEASGGVRLTPTGF